MEFMMLWGQGILVTIAIILTVGIPVVITGALIVLTFWGFENRGKLIGSLFIFLDLVVVSFFYAVIKFFGM